MEVKGETEGDNEGDGLEDTDEEVRFSKGDDGEELRVFFKAGDTKLLSCGKDLFRLGVVGPKGFEGGRGEVDVAGEAKLSGAFSGERMLRRFNLFTNEGLGLFPASLPARQGEEDGDGADMIDK